MGMHTRCVQLKLENSETMSKTTNAGGICPHCETEESMEHILTQCEAPGREHMETREGTMKQEVPSPDPE